MKKYGKWIFALFAILIIAGIIAYFSFFNNKNSDFSSSASRMSTNTATNTEQGNSINTEKEIASFSTKIMYEDSSRDNNMRISLSAINETVVKSGDTFSFNDIVGSPIPEKGYEKAGVFIDEELKEDYGGGNCQVSTTLYNAVLKIDGLEVTERHEHSMEVDYVEKGKDAAVAYGALDFKFKNNCHYDIKIYAEMSENEVAVKIVQLE